MKARGFTLVEVMIAIAMFACTAVAYVAFYVTTAQMSESSRNLTQATNDVRAALEMMRNTAQSGGLAGVTTTYRDGNPIVLPGVVWSLPAEAIRPTYTAPAADPLPVTVQVSWTEAGGRARTTTINTLMTSR